jgi:hypothetical protein
MIKVDISRVVSPRFGLYLLGVIPGVFFESSAAIGNPHSIASLMGRLHEIYPFGPYALLLLFLASSLFIGSGFFVAAWILQLLISLGFRLWHYGIRITFASQRLYRCFAKLQGIPPRRNIFIRSLSKLISWARGRELFTEARPVLRCLHTATTQLLQERYGIEINGDRRLDSGDWNVWHSVIGKPLKALQEGTMAARTFLGCGLAGFTALYVAPALRERYFIALCSMFAVSGLLPSFSLAFWSFNSVRRSLLRLKSVLLALAEVTTATERRNAGSEANANERE